MKHYKELTSTQQQRAVSTAKDDVLLDILEGNMYFYDELNNDDVQARIDAAVEKADKMQTPWFVSEYILNDEVVEGVLRGIAQQYAENAIYLEFDEIAIQIPEE